MIADKKIEDLENSAVQLTVTVEKDAAKKAYTDLLKKYAKSVQMKGFRKGKVPTEVLERKYGEGIRQEAAYNLIDESLKTVFDEIDKKPLSYKGPELKDEPVLDPDKEFSYSVTYDIFPEFEVKDYKGVEVTEPQAKISKEDLEKELKTIQDQQSLVVEKKKPVVAKDDIVTIDYVELDEEGNGKEGEKREDFVFTVGTGYNLYKFDDDIIGMKKDEEKIIEKTYGEDEENKDLAGRTVKIKVTVKTVKEKQLPELDDELAQDISDKYETLDDLKKDIKERLEKSLADAVRREKIDSLMDKLVEKTEIAVPESMIEAELEQNWRNFLNQSRMPEEQLLQLLEIQGKTKDEFIQEWRPQTEKSVRSQLIIGNLIEEEKIEVSDEEYDKEIERQAEASGMSVEDTKNYINQNHMKEYITQDIKNTKIFDLLLENAKIKKGDKTTYLDLVQKNS